MGCQCDACQAAAPVSTKPAMGCLPYSKAPANSSYSKQVTANTLSSAADLLALIEANGAEYVVSTYPHYSTMSSVLYQLPATCDLFTLLDEVLYPIWAEGDKQHEMSWNDIYCATCEHYVSKLHDFTHWDDICADCNNHTGSTGSFTSECNCCSECHLSPCECCEVCSQAPGWCECCTYCGMSEYDCECEDCEDCGYKAHNCQCGGSSGGSYHRFGSIKKAPWAERSESAIPLALDKVPTLDECDNENIDPIRAAADFYLLDAIKNNVRIAAIKGDDSTASRMSDIDRLIRNDDRLSAVTVAARREYDALVARLDRTFLAYGIAAVGGELRYHRACGSVLPNSRSSAWKSFVSVVSENGADVLFDAVDLFEDFQSNSYGGHKWAQIAQVVAQRASGKMPAWLFVDRIITLQHNGGCVLNKLNWARSNGLGWDIGMMQSFLNAHAGCCSKCGSKWSESGCCPDATEMTDYALLCAAASPGVAHLFQSAESSINRLARRVGGTLTEIAPSPQMRGRGRSRRNGSYCSNCGSHVGSSGYCYSCNCYVC